VENANGRGQDGLVIFIADLRRLNITTLNYDPQKNGGGGETITLWLSMYDEISTEVW
jgi:hypothetical protein